MPQTELVLDIEGISKSFPGVQALKKVSFSVRRNCIHGLVGEKIPICGRIVGLSDVFDALTSNRPYKTPYPVEVAIDIMEKEREKHFDPEMFDVFRNNIERFIAIKYEVGNPEDVNLSEFTMSARDRIVQVS